MSSTKLFEPNFYPDDSPCVIYDAISFFFKDGSESHRHCLTVQAAESEIIAHKFKGNRLLFLSRIKSVCAILGNETFEG